MPQINWFRLNMPTYIRLNIWFPFWKNSATIVQGNATDKYHVSLIRNRACFNFDFYGAK